MFPCPALGYPGVHVPARPDRTSPVPSLPESSLGPRRLWALAPRGRGADLQGHPLPWAKASSARGE